MAKKKTSKKATSKPTVAPKKVDVTISGSKVKTSYTVPAAATKESSSKRYTKVTTRYYQLCTIKYKTKKGKGKKKKTVTKTKKNVPVYMGSVTKSPKSTANSSKVKKGMNKKFKSNPYQRAKKTTTYKGHKASIVAVTGVRTSVNGKNDSKKSSPTASDTLKIKEFSKPTIEDNDVDTSTGIWTIKISTQQGTDDGKLPFDKICYKVTYNANGDTNTLVAPTQTSSKEVTRQVAIPYWNNLASDERVVIKVYARVKAKNSDPAMTYKTIDKSSNPVGWSALATFTRIFSRPPKYSITSVVYDYAQDYMFVNIDREPHDVKKWPVDLITLQYLISDTLTLASSADNADGWQNLQNQGEDVTALGRGEKDDSSYIGLRFSPPIVPMGSKIFLRIISKHDQYTTVGDCVSGDSQYCKELKILEPLPASMGSSECEILDESGTFDSGDKVLLYFGYKKKGDRQAVIDTFNDWNNQSRKYNDDKKKVYNYDVYDYGDGTEVSWSDDADTWESTESPSTYQLTKDDTSVHENKHSSKVWDRGSHVYVKGLTQNVAYYFRGRRYGNSDDTFKFVDDETEKVSDTAYGPYSNMVKVIPTSQPKAVELKISGDRTFVPRGDYLNVYWTFKSSQDNLSQRAYMITNAASKSNDLLVSEETSRMSSAIDTSLFGADAKTGSIKLYMTTSPRDSYDQYAKFDITKEHPSAGTWGVSEIVNFEIVDRPTVQFTSVPSTVTKFPLTLGLKCTTGTLTDSQELEVSVSIKAEKEMIYDRPDGRHIQLEDETVWTEDYSTYDRDSDKYTNVISVEIPADVLLIDTKTYRVEIGVRNTVTGLYDNIAYEESLETAKDNPAIDKKIASLQSVFKIDLLHKAVEPSSLGIKVQSTNGTKGSTNSAQERSVMITSSKTKSILATDTLEIWRVTPDGFYQIGGGIPIGTTVYDRYAPYSTNAPLYYVIGVRTAEGDLNWDEFPYAIRASVLRFDWDGKYLELPWNVDVSDSYDKNFEASDKLGGDHDGYFALGGKHNGSLKSTVLKVDHKTRIMLKSMAKYPGAIFVRTPDGGAYAANVTVSDIAYNHNEKVYDVSISTEEITLTNEFKINSNEYYEGSIVDYAVKSADDLDLSDPDKY